MISLYCKNITEMYDIVKSLLNFVHHLIIISLYFSGVNLFCEKCEFVSNKIIHLCYILQYNEFQFKSQLGFIHHLIISFYFSSLASSSVLSRGSNTTQETLLNLDFIQLKLFVITCVGHGYIICDQ